MNIVFSSTVSKVVAFAFVALFLTGAVMTMTPRAHAANLTEPQIQAILGLLSSFGADQSVITNVTGALRGTAVSSSETTPSSSEGSSSGSSDRSCPQMARTLGVGARGSDVSDLQAYLGVSQTGYFGPMTAKAVSAFQANEGLSQVGVVGPQTRAAFARRCGGGTTNNPNTPTTPNAPYYGTPPTNTTPGTTNSSSINSDLQKLDALIGTLDADLGVANSTQTDSQ